MEPFYFGNERRLFGIRSEPSGAIHQTAILICASWGAEYMRSYRALYLLSEQLAARGFDVLRFDYSCTGDSEGDAAHASLEDWVADIGIAARELRDATGAPKLCLLGVRLGALLASRAVERGVTADRMLLWDRPSSGAAWLEDAWKLDQALAERKNRYTPSRPLLPPTPGELLGLPFSRDLEGGIAGLNAIAPLDSAAMLFAHSADFVTASVGDDSPLHLPDDAHWADSAWLTRLWSPAQSVRTLGEKLASWLP